MSNPAVISLSAVETKLGWFVAEDNIGEAIHLHLGEMRLDLTVESFFSLCEDIRRILEKFLDIDGFDLSEFSMEFLSRWAERLTDIERIEHAYINTSRLIIDTRNRFGIPVYRPIKQSRIVKALKGNSKENDRRQERNYFGETNGKRLERILESIKTNGYPEKKKYIVLVNDKNIIYDGQHRAGCIYFLKGGVEIPVIRIYFKDNQYNINTHTYLLALFGWNRKRFRKLARKAYHMLRYLIYRTEEKYISMQIRIDKRKYRKHAGE